MEYLDFELRIGPGAGRDYPITVVRSPAGESSGTMRFPFDTLALQNQLQALEIAVLRSGSTRRDVVSTEEASVNDFGRQLFESLLSEKVHETFQRSRDRARTSGKGLRLRLRIEAPELASLPWEYLYDQGEGDFVALSMDTPLVRYLEFDRPPEALTIKPPLSILGVISSPSDRPALDVAREKQRIETATSGLQKANLIKLTWLQGSTWRDLQRAMRGGPYHILHFVGHGGFDAASGEGVIALTNDDGTSALLTSTQLGRLLADHDSLRMVILNSCLGAKGSGTDVFSSTATTLIRRGVPAVVAMQYEISDIAAVEFARSLYEALADGMPIDGAVTEARKAISMAQGRTVEWGTPVLHMRSPDGTLFRIDGPTTSMAKMTGEYKSASFPAVSLSSKPEGILKSEATLSSPELKVDRSAVPSPAAAPLGFAALPAAVSGVRLSPRTIALIAGIGVLGGAALVFAMLSGGGEDDYAADSAFVADSIAAVDSAAKANSSRGAPSARDTNPSAAAAPLAAGGAPATTAAAADADRTVTRYVTLTAQRDATPAATFTPANARIDSVALSRLAQGEWTMKLFVQHTPTSQEVDGLVNCRLGGQDARAVTAVIPVPMGPNTTGGQFSAYFQLAQRLTGPFPLACTTRQGEKVFSGSVTF